jgi:hypothetical protein
LRQRVSSYLSYLSYREREREREKEGNNAEIGGDDGWTRHRAKEFAKKMGNIG